MAVSSSSVERWTPRRICFSVMSAKKRSTRFTQELAVGVKSTYHLGHAPSHFRIAGVVVVHDQARFEFGRDVASISRRSSGTRVRDDADSNAR
jgi:hypothetical protein